MLKEKLDNAMKNISASVATDSEFEKRLFKATYNQDMKEPKEKHVQYLIECFSDKHEKDISSTQALIYLIERHKKEDGNFVINTKSFCILHQCLQVHELNKIIAQFIKLDGQGKGYLKFFDKHRSN